MMTNKFDYWYFTSVLSKDFCQEIINCGLKKSPELATVGAVGKKEPFFSKKEIKKIKKFRYSDIVWLDEPWIYQEILPYVKIANNASGWNYQWHQSESAQFTIYKKNQYYKWHQDSDYSDSNTLRKLSVSISLSDPKDYKGGILEIDNRRLNVKKSVFQVKEILPQGSIVVFPSYLWHRVTPVTKGVRYSAVIWALGKPLK